MTSAADSVSADPAVVATASGWEVAASAVGTTGQKPKRFVRVESSHPAAAILAILEGGIVYFQGTERSFVDVI